MDKKINIPIRKVILLVIMGVLILMFSDIPYLNLLANTQVLFFIVWLLAVFTLNLSSKTMLFSFFTLLFYCLILLLLGQNREVQAWGDYAFPILILTLVKYYWENRKEITRYE